MNEQHRCIEYMIDTIVKSVLAEIQEVFCEDKGWDNEEKMIC